MDSLLSYYEHELALFKRHAKDFSKKYPKVATRLLMAGDTVEDPHIERLIQSFSLISARIHKKLEDRYADFTDALMSVVFPDYLKHIPACSIIQFDLGKNSKSLSEAHTVEKSEALVSRKFKNMTCQFKTTQAVELHALAISDFSFSSNMDESSRLGDNLNGQLNLTFQLTNANYNYNALLKKPIRLFIDHDSTAGNLLWDILVTQVQQATLSIEGKQQRIHGTPFTSAGFDADEGLLPYHPSVNAATRLMMEYFYLPEKFDFVDLDLSSFVNHINYGDGELSLSVLFKYDTKNTILLKTLKQITAASLKLFCTPVVNLIELPAVPIKINQTKTYYDLLPDVRLQSKYEVYQVDKVYQVKESVENESIVSEFHPFYALNHYLQERKGQYYHVKRDETLAEYESGHEYQIMISDPLFDTESNHTEVVSAKLTCSNRNVPSLLPFGQKQGDLFSDKAEGYEFATFLRRPTETYRFKHDGDDTWRLISLLSLNFFSLAHEDANLLREFMSLYDVVGSLENKKIIEGVLWTKASQASMRLMREPQPGFVRGTRIDIGVIPENFVGSSIGLFAELMSYVFGCYASLNSFVQVVVLHADTEEELFICKPRSGHSALI